LTEFRRYYVSFNEFVIGFRAFFACFRGSFAPTKALPSRAYGAIMTFQRRRRRMFDPGDTDPSQSLGGAVPARTAPAQVNAQVTFSRRELNRILDLYGRKVAAGEWRDYAIDFLKDRAVFSVFRRTSEVPIYRIEKNPKLSRRQGVYSVISATGLIVRRSHELDRVLRAIDRSQLVVVN
jgi:hypothetical protein